MSVKEIFNQVLHGKPHIHIGKYGISNKVIEQINKIFKNKQIIKVRFLDLHNFNNTKEAAVNLSKLTSSKLLDVRGKTCILYKKKINKI